VTHPFHPLLGREFKIVTVRQNWGEHRVYYHDEDKRLRSIPAAWTSVFGEDPFVMVAAGRSPFRANDLVELRWLIDAVGGRKEGSRGDGRASDV